jgi:hypothetical protein
LSVIPAELRLAPVTLPPDPAAFVAAAERGINERSLEATVGAYSDTARLESLTDGAWEAYEGIDEIRAGWTAYLDVMAQRDFRLSKRLLGAEDDLVVNDWTGEFGGAEAKGIEHWRFDDEGRVSHHRMYSFLNVKPSANLQQRLRLTVAYPLGALAFLGAQRRAGARPRS